MKNTAAFLAKQGRVLQALTDEEVSHILVALKGRQSDLDDNDEEKQSDEVYALIKKISKSLNVFVEVAK